MRRQLVSSLQVHLAFGDADCTLGVYHALRDRLPELAALAAAAPFAAGRDTGLCSVRPVIASQLPRQGVPPIIASWEQYADDLAWAVGGGAVADVSEWWWELRPHVRYGTLELRVLDVQATVDRTTAITRFVHALAAGLADLHRLGDLQAPAPTWRIAENRWSALRDGVGGELLDLRTGESRPTRSCLRDLVDVAEPYAPGGLDDVRAMVEHPPVDELRDLGPDRVVPWLAEVFTAGGPDRAQLARDRCGSVWVPSQNGGIALRPQRQSAMVRRAAGIGPPSSSSNSKSPRTRIGPSG